MNERIIIAATFIITIINAVLIAYSNYEYKRKAKNSKKK